MENKYRIVPYYKNTSSPFSYLEVRYKLQKKGLLWGWNTITDAYTKEPLIEIINKLNEEIKIK